MVFKRVPEQNAGSVAGETWRPSVVPKHVAIIMDGNGRWAKARHLPRLEGHRAGAKTVRMVVEESRRVGIRYLTLFAFSTENWRRPAGEVSGLMSLFAQYLESEVPLLLRNGIRLRGLGNREALPSAVSAALSRCEEATASCSEMELIIAVSYGAREEIANACRRIASAACAGQIDPNSINEETVAANLYAPEVPDPDLLIRTSDENRVSNFLLWQLAYSEIVVSPVLWPEFSKDEYRKCLFEFSGRERRFGLTKDQLADPTSATTIDKVGAA